MRSMLQTHSYIRLTIQIEVHCRHSEYVGDGQLAGIAGVDESHVEIVLAKTVHEVRIDDLNQESCLLLVLLLIRPL